MSLASLVVLVEDYHPYANCLSFKITKVVDVLLWYSHNFLFFLPLQVTIPYGHALEFILTDSTGHQHILQADDSSTDIK